MIPQILVVDDEPFMLRLIGATLRKGAWAVLSCRSGEEALAAVAHGQPDLIILDLMMPGLDGIETLRGLRESPAGRAVPVIMLTAKGQAREELEAAASGADVFLTKPFSPRELLEEATRLLCRQPAAPSTSSLP